MKINDIEGLFWIISLRVPQGFIISTIWLNIFINDLLLMFFKNETKLINFEDDDNTIYTARKYLNDIRNLLEKQSKVNIKRFIQNNMIVNYKSS